MVDGPDTAAWVEAQNDRPGDQTAYYFANDFTEQSNLAQYYPSQTAPWWGQAAVYGVTRAIDAAVGSRLVGGGSQPGTYAGQNGQTYAGNGQPSVLGGGNGGLVLLLLVGAALFVMND